MDTDLDRPLSFVLRDDRPDAIFEEIDALDRFVRIEKRRFQRQRDRLEMRFKQGIIGGPEGPQQKVFWRRDGHAPASGDRRSEEPPSPAPKEVGTQSAR